MKRTIIFGLGLAIALSAGVVGCKQGPEGIASTPAEVADTTKVDEQAALGAEVLYTTASTLGNTLSRAGAIDRAKFQALDAKAYDYLLAVRAAYKAGNSGGFVEALSHLNDVVGQIRDLNKGASS